MQCDRSCICILRPMAFLRGGRSFNVYLILFYCFWCMKSFALPASTAPSSFGAQSLSLSLNATSSNTQLTCVANRDWLSGGINSDDCHLLVNSFYARIHKQQDYLYDFLGPGLEPHTHLPTFIRTPLKYTLGKLVLSCTSHFKLKAHV